MSETSRERQRVEENLTRLREAIGREIGWAPRARAWILPIAAFAVGVAVALNRRAALPPAGAKRSVPPDRPRRLAGERDSTPA
jgi:hypothetical protein